MFKHTDYSFFFKKTSYKLVFFWILFLYLKYYSTINNLFLTYSCCYFIYRILLFNPSNTNK